MRTSACALLIALTLAVSGCGGSGGKPVKIGVLADCTGALGAFRDLELGAAELPLLERGGKLKGKKPSEGVSGAKAGGRRVDLVTGCAESTTYSVLIAEARRLVEDEHVDVLIGPPLDSDGLVLRELARRSPHVTFLLTLSRAQETTLRDPAPNVFRFQPDGPEQAAGLGSYAYNQLHWRTAAVVGEDFETSWSRVAGFVAEFCALGGRVEQRLFPPVGGASPALAAKIRRGVDGVALIPAIAFIDWSGFVKAYAKRQPHVARHLALGPEVLILPEHRAHLLPFAKGVVAGGSEQYEADDPVWLRVRNDFGRYFPGVLPRQSVPAQFPLALAYRNAAEAVAEALERVGGDLSSGERRFMAALARLRISTPTGSIRLDRNRQAVASAYLTRLDADGKGKPLLHTVRVVPGVEQTFNGYFTGSTPPPSTTSPACRRAPPPAWAAGS